MLHAQSSDILKSLPQMTGDPLQFLNPTLPFLLEYQKIIPTLVDSILNRNWQQINALIATGCFYKNAKIVLDAPHYIVHQRMALLMELTLFYP